MLLFLYLIAPLVLLWGSSSLLSCCGEFTGFRLGIAGRTLRGIRLVARTIVIDVAATRLRNLAAVVLAGVAAVARETVARAWRKGFSVW